MIVTFLNNDPKNHSSIILQCFLVPGGKKSTIPLTSIPLRVNRKSILLSSNYYMMKCKDSKLQCILIEAPTSFIGSECLLRSKEGMNL